MIQTQKKMQRQEKILLVLDEFNYMTRKQLQIINNLGGDRNAHRILFGMEKDKLISSIRTEQKIYYISNKGKGFIGSQKPDLSKDRVTHALMCNDMYIKLNFPSDWRKEKPVKLNGEVFIIPDATFTSKGEYHFVEIDNRQTMRTNLDKIAKYKELSRVIFEQFSHTPTLLWYTLSDVRRQKLTEACKKAGVKYVIH